MKILQLHFSNLNSLRGTHSIDFENGPLAESGLFAITGPTGVGKTTILDAITLGLFGKAARYDNHKASTPENMMSRGTGECFAEVVFSCQSGTYSVRWDLARARKKPDGKVQAAKRQIATRDGEILDNKIREVDQRVIALTGLDYNRFLRSVLLAQGRFKEFLEAGSNERSELLEKITGTQIYSDLSIAAFARARAHQAEIEKAKQALEGIRLLDTETIAAYTTEQTELGKKLDEAETNLKSLTDRIALYDQYVELTKQQQTLATRLEAWYKSDLAFAPETKRIETFDRASPLAPDLTKWTDLTQKTKRDEFEKKAAADQFHASQQIVQETLSQALAACELSATAIQEKRETQAATIRRETALFTEIEAWLKTNEADQTIASSLPPIRSLGEQCRLLAQKSLNHTASLKAIESRTQKSVESKAKLDANHAKAEANLALESQETKRLSTLLQKTLAGKTKDSHKKTLEQAQERIAQTRELHSLQTSFRNETASLEEKKKAETLEAKAAEQLDLDLQKLATDLAQERAILKDKETIHLQAAAIASLEERRAALVDGKPCELCGATDHPYASSALPSESETKKARDLQLQKVDTLVLRESKLNKARAATQERRLAAANARLDLEKRITQCAASFTEITTLMKADLSVHDTEALAPFEAKQLAERDRLSTLIETIESNEKSLADAEKKEAAARAEVSSLSEQLRQQIQAANDLAEEQKREQQNADETSTKQKTATEDFSKSITPWLPNSTDETQAAIATLETRSNQFTEKRKQETDTKTRIETSQRETKRLDEEHLRLLTEKEEWQTKLLAAKMDLLPARPFPQNIPWTETERRRNSETATEAMTRFQAELKLKTENSTKSAAEHAELTKQLQAGALEIGFPDLPHLSAVLSDREAISALRLKQRAIQDEKTEIAALSKKREADLQTLQAKQPPSEEEAAKLKLDSQKIRAQQTEFSERRGELRSALANDHNARSEQKEQIDQIARLEKDARPWLVLSDLIGSANGSSFSRFAQGLTLAQLVIFANKHLRELNPRYRIHRTDESVLELEIIDCHEANAIRPTRSLSGGESFLVSLALALGLSELAGRNTKIESLFIDEGFGSLDTDTLDIALSALENLRLQNRTIGVISHVEELKVRITTQVQVLRTNTAQATLKIVA